MDKKVAIRKQMYDMMEQVANAPIVPENKDIILTQDIKGVLKGNSKQQPIQIVYMQNLTINTTVINCVNVLRLLDGLMPEDEPINVTSGEVVKRGEKKKKIIELLNQGIDIGTIASTVGTTPTYVYQVKKGRQK